MGDVTSDDYVKPGYWSDLSRDFDELRGYWETQKQTIRSFNEENEELRKKLDRVMKERDEWRELVRRHEESQTATQENFHKVWLERNAAQEEAVAAHKLIVQLVERYVLKEES